MNSGTVKFYNSQKGFGFIRQQAVEHQFEVSVEIRFSETARSVRTLRRHRRRP
jgi:cold shock CspA family protein